MATPPDNELYYFENGFMVFTEKYHLNRGYCCKNGCRHCPYGFNKKAKDKTAEDKPTTGKPVDKP